MCLSKLSETQATDAVASTFGPREKHHHIVTGFMSDHYLSSLMAAKKYLAQGICK